MKKSFLQSIQLLFSFERPVVFLRLMAFCSCVVGLLVYSSALPNPFIWDDFELIIHNPLIRTWESVPALFAGNVIEQSSFYRPIQMLTYLLDFKIWGVNAKGFHLSSILFHIGVSISLALVVAQVARNNLSGFLAGIVFLVHPIHNEAIAYISGRADPLAAMFLLLSFLFYLKYLDKTRLFDYLVCVFLFTAAILSKEMAVILPLLLGLYHGIFRRRMPKELLFMLVSIAGIYIVLRLFNVIGVADMHDKTQTIFLQRLPGAFAAQAMYVKQLIWPTDLFMGYGQELFSWSDIKVWLGFMVWCALIAWAVLVRHRQPFVAFGLAWYLVALLPVMNIYPVNAYMAEHWLYIPSMGLIMLLGHGLVQWGKHWKLGRPCVVLSSTMVVILLSLIAYRQNYVWRDPIGFYQRIVTINPKFTKAYNNLGKMLSQQGRYEEASQYFLESIKIDPRFVKGYHNYAVCMAKLERFDEAVAYYHKALSVRPDFAATYNNLGALYIDVAQFDQAEQYVMRALSLNREMPKAYYNLGLIAQARKQSDKARDYFQLALKYNPNFSAAKNNLGSMLGREGNMAEAVKHYHQVLAMEPQNYTVMNNLGILYGRLGKREKALGLFRSALKIKPDFADAHFNIAYAFAQKKSMGQAMRHYQDAIKYDPDHQQAINNLAIIYAQLNRFEDAEKLFEKALEFNQSDYSTRNNLGLVYAKQGKKAKAKDQYLKSLAINARHKETHNNLAMLYETSGNIMQAEKHYEEALKIDPDFDNALNGLGIIYGKQNRLGEAEKMFLRALKVNPNRHDAKNNLKRARQLISASKEP